MTRMVADADSGANGVRRSREALLRKALFASSALVGVALARPVVAQVTANPTNGGSITAPNNQSPTVISDSTGSGGGIQITNVDTNPPANPSGIIIIGVDYTNTSGATGGPAADGYYAHPYNAGSTRTVYGDSTNTNPASQPTITIGTTVAGGAAVELSSGTNLGEQFYANGNFSGTNGFVVTAPSGFINWQLNNGVAETITGTGASTSTGVNLSAAAGSTLNAAGGSVNISGFATGVNATSAAGVTVNTTGGGTISATTTGILASTGSGTGAISVTSGSAITVGGGGTGISAVSNGGAMSVATVAGGTIDGGATGIVASGATASNTTSITVGAAIGSTTRPTTGINATGAGVTGDTIAINANVSGGTYGIQTNSAFTTTVGAVAVVTGGTDGVNLAASGGTVSNAGKIVGSAKGVVSTGGTATITNTGTIGGGTVTNGNFTPGGAGFAVEIANGTVTNSGTLQSGEAALYQTSNTGTLTLTNTGTIGGTTTAQAPQGGNPDDTLIANGVATIVNSGTIASPNFYAIDLNQGGTVTNAAGGLIQAGTSDANRRGIVSNAALGVTNYGTISSQTYNLGIQVNNNAKATIVLEAGSTTGSIATGSSDDLLTLYNGLGTANQGLLYNTATGATTIGGTAGTNQVVLQNSGAVAAAALSGTVDLGGGTNTLTLAGTGNGTSANGAAGTIDTSTIANLTNLAKQDSGTWILTGTAAYTGTTTISGGTLIDAGVGTNPYGNPTLTALGNGATTIASGATLQFDNETGGLVYVKGGQFSGAGTILFTGNAGAATALGYGGNGNATISLSSGGLIDVESGTVNGSSSSQGFYTGNQGSLNIAAGATFDGVEGDVIVDKLTGSGTLRGGYGTSGSTTIGIANGSSSFNGTIADDPNPNSPLKLIKAGSGTITLTGTNSYTGATTISGGTLALSGSGTIATSASLADNATFDISGLTNGGTTVGTLTGSGLVKLGANTLTLASPGTIAVGISDGGIAGGTGGKVTLSSAGTYVFTGANSYTGATTINSGATLQGTAATLSPSSAIVDNGTLAFVQGGLGGTFSPGVSGNGGITVSGTGANTLTFAGALTNKGALSITDASLVSIGGSINTSAATAVTGAAGSKLTNLGTITSAAGGGGNGAIQFSAGGTVINGASNNTTASIGGNTYSTIYDTGGALSVTNYGVLSTAGYAIVAQGGNGANPTSLTLNNSGKIVGGAVAVVSNDTTTTTTSITNSGQLVAGNYNAGTITVGATGSGVTMQAGTVTNNAGGQIVGGTNNSQGNADGVLAQGAATITNSAGTGALAAGKIVGGYVGVELDAGGTVNNYGLIASGTFAVGNTGTTVTSGFTAGGQDGIRLVGAGGTVNGFTGSEISGSASAIYIEGSSTVTTPQIATVTNSGLITASNGVYASRGTMGTVALTVTNQTGGAITATSGNAIYNSNNDISLTNAGTIQQTGTNGNQAVNLTGNLTLTNSGTISNAATNANYTIYDSGNLAATSSNSGTIVAGANSYGLYITGTTGLTNTGGTIVGGTEGLYSGGSATIVNTGLIGAGTLANGTSGAFTANGHTAVAIAGGSLTNGSTGTIGGALTSSAALTLSNAGAMNAVTVTGAGNSALTLRSGSTTGAVTLAAGDDSVTLYNGTNAAFTGVPASYVTGGTHAAATLTSLNLGGGTNTITLAGSGDGATNGAAGALALNTVTGLSTLVKTGSGNWTLSGAATGATAAATIYAGNQTTPGASGILQFTNTSGLTGAIYQNGTTVQVDGASALGGGALHIVSTAAGQADLSFLSISAIGNAISLETNGAAAILQSGTGVTGTINGVIANGSGTTNIDGQTIAAAPVTVQGGGTIVFAGANTYTGLTTVTGAGTVLSLSGGNAIADTNALQVGNGGTLSLAASETIASLNDQTGQTTAGAVALNSNTLTLGGDNSSSTFSGVISGTNASDLTKTGSGTLTLSGANTFTGTLLVNAGMLAYGANNVLADTATVTVAAGATFNLANYSDTIGTLNLYGTLSNGGLLTATTYNAYAGSTINQAISSGTLNVYGNTTLNNATAASPVNIYAGTLTTGAADVLSDTGAVAIASSGTLALGGNETIGSLGDASYMGSTGGGTVQLGANTLTVGGMNANGAGSFSGALTSTTGGGFTKDGSGTLILSGANSYNGVTTIAGGTLQGTSSSISGSSIVDNATLVYAQTNAGNVAQNISGSGGVVVSGLGAGNTLTFSGTDTQSNGFVVADTSNVAFTGAASGAATEVTLQGASTLTNTGTISGGLAVNATAAGSTIVNYGTIAGTGGTAIALAGGTVANAGGATITGAVTSSAGLNFYNAGTAGTVTDSGNLADAMILAPGSTTGAVTTGAGDDMLTLYNGMGTASPALTSGGQTLVSAGTHAAAAVGAIDLGSGNNTLNLRGGGDDTAANGVSNTLDLSTVVSAGTIAKSDTGTWTLTGAVSDPVTANATIQAGNGSPSGLLTFAGSGLTGTIDVNGAVIRATAAGAFGTGTINAIDPTIQYAATGAYANPIVLQSTNTATDPTVLETYGAGITATLTGNISQSGTTAQPLQFASLDATGAANSGTFVLTNTANAWSGTTTVAGGTGYATTLQGATNTISGSNIVDNGVVDFAQTTAGTSNLAISGSGVVQVNGGGNVALTGAITTQGGLQVGAGGIATLTNASGATGAEVTFTGNGATLNVVSGGQVTATGGNALTSAYANNGLTNAGTVSSANSTAVAFSGSGGTDTIANTGTISGYNAVYDGSSTLNLANSGTLTGTGLSAVAAYGTLNLTNAGTIAATTQGYAVFANVGGTIANQAGGTISGNEGIYAGGAATIDNDGMITSRGAGDGIDAGGGGTITNHADGTITATGDPQAYGIDVFNTAANVTNAGAINAGSGLVIEASGTSFANSGTIAATVNGVLGDGASFTLTNSGSITGGTTGVSAQTAGSTITNSGTIAGSASGAVGVAMAGGSLVNQAGGTISAGQTGGAYGTAIALTGSNNSVRILSGSTVNGTIDASATTDATGTYRIGGTLNGSFLGGSGADTLTLFSPATITGTLNGGAGSDTLVLDGTGAGALASNQVVAFETGVKQGSGSWTLTGTTASSPNAWQVNAGTLTVAGGNAITDTASVAVATGATFNLAASETIDALNGAGAVTLGANTLSVGAGNGAGSFAGILSGTGGLTKLGTGTQTLSGLNSYTGATTVNGGTLQLGAANALSTGTAVTVATGATLDLQANSDTVASLALSGTLAGSGTLTATSYRLNGAAVNANLGAGTLTNVGGTSTLNGTAGATTVAVNAGTLALGASNRLADTAAVTVASGATLNMGAFTDTVGTATLAGTLAGSGTLTAATYALNGATVNANLGAGTLTNTGGVSTLAGTTGASTVAVNAGTLRLAASQRLASTAALSVASGATFNLAGFSQTVGSVTDAGTIALGAGTLTDAGLTASSITGDVTGTGSLVQAGGTLTLTGAKSLTGTIALNGGATAFTGSTAGNVRVGGGTLSGNASIAGSLTLAAGTLSPGGTGTIGSFSAGSLAVSGGTLAADVTGVGGNFAADTLKVSGVATLTGGTVAVSTTGPTADYHMTQDYVLVQAGSVSGTFAAANSSFTQTATNSSLYYRLRYDLVPNEVLIELRKQVDLTQGLGTTGTPNQYAVANALNGGALTGSDAYVSAVSRIADETPAQQAATFSSLSGESVANVTTAAITASNRFVTMLRDRISIGGVTPDDPQMLIAGLFGRAQTFQQARTGASTQGAAAMGLADGHDAPFGGSDTPHAGFWVQGFGAAGTIDGSNGASKLTDSSTGIAAGIDAQFGLFRLGGAFAADHLDTKLRSLASTSTGTLHQGAVYAAYDNGQAYANLIGSYFSGSQASTRQVFVGGTAIGTASGRPDLTGWSGAGAAGYRIALANGVRLTPQIDGGFTHVRRDGFSENGIGVFSLDVAQDKRTTYTAGGELRLSKPFALGGGTVEPYVSGGVVFNLGDRTATSAMRFDGAPTGTGAFTVTGAELPREAARITTGVQVQATTRVSFGAGAEALLANRQHEAAVNMHIRIGF